MQQQIKLDQICWLNFKYATYIDNFVCFNQEIWHTCWHFTRVFFYALIALFLNHRHESIGFFTLLPGILDRDDIDGYVIAIPGARLRVTR